MNQFVDLHTNVVVMAGGAGTRLWPASTPDRPKQFLDILGLGRSLLQMTFDRFCSLCTPDRFWVVTSSTYKELVISQLPGVPEDNVLCEPEPRNTAPCIAYACWRIAKRDPLANIIVTPSDALVVGVESFTSIIAKALERTASSGDIITIGIKPTRPETGYGYTQAQSSSPNTITKVLQFKEKPDIATAQAYLSDGNYYWNAGIFVWSAATIKHQIRTHCPSLASVMDLLEPSLATENEPQTLRELFPKCEKISIDYAVMEKSRDIFVISGDFVWSDLGSWSAVGNQLDTDTNGNACVGSPVRLIESKNCLVFNEGYKAVVVQGLDSCLVACGDGGVLVCQLSQDQRIKEFSAKIETSDKKTLK